MSASREKKKRQSNPEIVSAAAAPKKSGKKGLKVALTVVVSIVLVAAIVFLGMVSTGFFQKNLVAAEINGHKLSPAMLNYHYMSAYQNLQNYMGTVIDTNIPLDEQKYTTDEFETWADYVLDSAVRSATNVYAIYDEAMEQGYVISEEGQAQVDSELQTLDLYAYMYGFSDGNAMLTSQYGVGCNKNSYREYLTISTIASEYASKAQNDLTYTQEELDAYYAENSDSFDAGTYRFYAVTPTVLGLETTEDATEEDKAAQLAACEEAARSIAEAAEAGEQAFLDAVVASRPEDQRVDFNADSSTLRKDVPHASYPETYNEWLSDAARQEGDATYVAMDEDGYAVLYYIQEEDHSYALPNVRHILISTTNSSDDEAAAEAAKTEAKTEADAILETYLAGEQTEEAFADLAKEHSDDNAEEGGLYENIAPGTMVDAFDAWCFDEARQPGDVEIVETEYGYHVMYFVGDGVTYQNYLVENEMRYNDYQAWSDEVTGDVPCTINEQNLRFLVKI